MSNQKDNFLDCLKRAYQGDEAAMGELLGEFRPYLRILC